MSRIEQVNDNSFGLLRSVMMGLFSAVLFMTVFLTIFVPYPIAITYVLYGRLKAVAVFCIGLTTVYFLAGPTTNEFFIMTLYFVFGGGSLVVAGFGLAEIVKREIHPIKGIFIIAGLITLMNVFVLTTYSNLSGKPIKVSLTQSLEELQPWFKKNIEDMKEAGQENVFEFEAVFTQPEIMVDKFIEHGPSSYVEFLFLMLWMNLFLLLKGNRLVKTMNNCKYSEMTLMNFKMPEPFVWVVIGSLLVHLGGTYFEILFLTIIGMVFLKGLGVFYFFQGFDIYLSFLSFMKVTGLIRTFLIIITVFSAWPLLVCIGLADMFVNFKKLMVKKDEGDS
jgi:uncharacterized protein YybS (DUF2232 family)